LAVAGLAGIRTYPLNSSFQPSYNMAVNLVGQVGRERAAKLLESSFAQFQADRAVVGLARKARKLRESVAGPAATCDRGDFVEYARLRSELSQLEKGNAKDRSAARRAAVVESLGALGRGDIIVVPGGRRAGTAVVLEPGRDSLAPSPLILTEHRQLKRLSLAECPDPVVAVMRIPIPGRFSPKSPQHRKDLTATMRNKLAGVSSERLHQPRGRNGQNGDRPGQAGEADRQIADLRRRLRDHPCHGCPDAQTHARQTDKFIRAEREAE